MGWFKKLTEAISGQAAQTVKTHYGDTDPLKAPPKPQQPAPSPKLTLPDDMGVRDQLAAEVEAVLKTHPDVVDVVVGNIRENGRSRICMKAVVRSNTVILDDLETFCERHPKLNGWFSQFRMSELIPLDGPSDLSFDEQNDLGEFVSVREFIPPAILSAARYQGSRTPAAVRAFLASDEYEQLKTTGEKYRRLRNSLAMARDTLAFLSPELRARLEHLDPRSFMDLDAFDRSGLESAAASEALVAHAEKEEHERQQAQAARLKKWLDPISKMEKHFANVHNIVTATVWPISEDGPKISFKVIVGRMQPKEATIWQYAYIAHATGTLDREGHNNCLKAALAKHPWDFEQEWNPTNPSGMEAKAGFIALYKKNLGAENIDEDYGLLVNMIHKIAQEQPQHPLVGWFQRRTGAGAGWATSR